MGRFSSVQAYTDTNANARTVPYAQATGSSEVKRGVVKPEKVVNPYGSAAGAGSGEFHVYRHARARELERLDTLKQSEVEALKDKEFQEQMKRNRQEEEERTEKRRKKRQRQKEAKQRKKNLAKVGVSLDSRSSDDADDEEFTYIPTTQTGGDAALAQVKPEPSTNNHVPPPAFPNDGSFLERIKGQLPQEQQQCGKILDAAQGRGDDSGEGLQPMPPPSKPASTNNDPTAHGAADGDDSDDESVGPRPLLLPPVESKAAEAKLDTDTIAAEKEGSRPEEQT